VEPDLSSAQIGRSLVLIMIVWQLTDLDTFGTLGAHGYSVAYAEPNVFF
jgi:hypothetical protein